jgi:DNA-binding MarR family transcriptional regulator
MHDLAQLTFQTDQSMGALAGRLIARGLIVRVSGPGRAVRHELTEKGRTLREEATGVMDGVLETSFAPLTTAELDTLHGFLKRLVHA